MRLPLPLPISLLLLPPAAAPDATESSLTYSPCGGGSDTVDFDVHEPDGGTGKIVSSDGRCLSVKDCVVPAPGSSGDWQAVVLEECGEGSCSGKHQQWTSIPVTGKEGRFYLQNGLGKGWCLNIPPNQAQASSQADLIVWGGVGGGKGCDPSVGDVSNQWFTLEHGHIQTDEVALSSELLTSCKPECCIAAAPCTPPACVWSPPLGWGGVFLIVFFVGGAAYLAGGGYYAARAEGKEVTGPMDVLAVHPHRSFWVSFAGLVADGKADCQARWAAYRAGEQYEKLQTAQPQSAAAPAPAPEPEPAPAPQPQPAPAANGVAACSGSDSEDDVVE